MATDQENRELSDWLRCKKCFEPRIIWLHWRQLFMCGNCGSIYTQEEAKVMRRIPEHQHDMAVGSRLRIIGKLDREIAGVT